MCGHSLMHRMSEKEQGGIGFQCGKRGEKKKRERDRVEGEERVFQKNERVEAEEFGCFVLGHAYHKQCLPEQACLLCFTEKYREHLNDRKR